MIALFCLCLALFVSPFKSKRRLEAENAALRHQLIVLRRKVRGRVLLTDGDRLFFIQLYRWFPTILNAITIVRPETLVRWHRAGFRRYWRWKSHSLGGRPQIDADLRALIRRMSVDNPLWGAPRIHGELLKLGFEVAQSGVAKYMVKRCGPPFRWRAFLRSHAPDIAAMDLFIAPTIGFTTIIVEFSFWFRHLYYAWSKEFLEAGKRRLAGDTARAASSGEAKDLRRQAQELKAVVAEQALELRLLKKSMIADGGDEVSDLSACETDLAA
jgi:hypothetical protein